MDPDTYAGRVRDFDIRMDLSHRDGQRGTSVDDRVFAEEDDLAGDGGVSHGSTANLSLRYDK